MSKTTFEKIGIPYEERDGIFYPVIVAGTEKADIDAGKYGRMWIKYIKEEYPMRYKSLVRFGELEERKDYKISVKLSEKDMELLNREVEKTHLIWNSVSITTGEKYNSPKGNWKNHLQPVTNKYCRKLGLEIMPAEYSKNPKNLSRDLWEKEMEYKEIILRDAKMCAYAAGDVEHFKYLMRSLGYIFKAGVWMEVQAPGCRYYHKLKRLDEMFAEDKLKYYVDFPYTVQAYFYSKDIRKIRHSNMSAFQERYYAKMYRLRIVEQKRFSVKGVKFTEELKRFYQLQDEYLMLVNHDIRSITDLLNYRSSKEEKIQQIRLSIFTDALSLA